MAASGLAGVVEAAAIEMAMDRKSPRVHLLQLNAIFSGAFNKNMTCCNGTDIAKYLESLNGVIPTAAVEPYLKASLTPKFNGYNNYGRRETFSARLGRSPSTDSFAASNLSSDQGSVDSCHYSSHGSDSNSGSCPCSPEEPDRYSRAGTPQPMPPIPPSLQEEEEEDKQCVYNSDIRTSVDDLCGNKRILDSKTKSKKASDTKHFYLRDTSCNAVPNSISVPSSSSFQRAENQNCISTCENSCSDKLISCNESSSSSSHSEPLSCAKPTCVQSNGSSHEQLLQRCSWHQCQSSIEGNDELVEHIRLQHVQVQKDRENFVCLWEGCKVYNRASCSLSWLERHVLSHGGNRPFKCIVDNCSQRFPTQAALQRHVNSHFEGNSQGIRANKYRDESLSKSFRRKKHLKYKKRSACGRTEDFFDANIMEQIRYKLTEKFSGSSGINSFRHVTFQSRVKARRVDKSGNMNVLLEWIPQNILPDCWVSQESVTKSKTVPVSSLPLESLAFLGLLSTTGSDAAPRVKRRRK